METTKVIIENLPNSPWYNEWIPIIIAIIALITSFISLYWTRQEYTRNIRPFVWASNYGVVDIENKTILPIPFRIACRVKNSPAKITQMDVKIILNKDVLSSHTEKDLIQFPDDTSEWSFSFGREEFERIMNRPISEQSNLKRVISITYTPLDGNKKYNYNLEQLFDPDENQWKDISMNSD
ncbi:MAG: hypothetical protein PHW92_03420 [Lutibacter sp.]|nr:hypothetical protein [Lutibacter sp.]